MLCQASTHYSLVIALVSWTCCNVRALSQMDKTETKVHKRHSTTYKISGPVKLKQSENLIQEDQAISNIYNGAQQKTLGSMASAFHKKGFDLDEKILNDKFNYPSVFQRSYQHRKHLNQHEIEQNKLNGKSSILKDNSKTHTQSDCSKNLMCNICLRNFSVRTCIEKYLIFHPVNENYIVKIFKQRRLLQSHKVYADITETSARSDGGGENLVTEDIIHKRNDQSTDSSASKKRMEDLRQLIEELKKDISKEPVWAMISVTFLMLVLIFVGKLCGMQVIKQGRDIHVDIDEDFHNVSVLEVVRVKRRFLPQGLFRLKSKLYRKFRKKHQRIKEKDISEPLTDDSEEERLIYDRLSPV